MDTLEVASVVGLRWFSRDGMLSFERSLRLSRSTLRDGSILIPSPKHIFHRYHKIRNNVKLGDIKVLQSTYRSECGRFVDLKSFSTSNA